LQGLSKAFKGHIALFIAQVIYAINYTVAKGLMPDFIDPMSIVFYRLIGAAILFWILSLFVKTQPVEKKDLLRLALAAFFGTFINQLFFIFGLNATTPINSSIIMISNPVIVFAFTLFAIKERITWPKLNGLLMAIAGAFLILRYRGNFEIGSATLYGDTLTLLNSIAWAIFIVMLKPITQKYNTVTSMRWIFLFGSIYILPVGLSSAAAVNWQVFTPGAWLSLGYVVIATTFLVYLLNIYGLESLSTNTVSAYIYLQPFLAALFAILVGKDELTLIKVLSGILIILGLYLVNRKSKQNEL
jgi:drug/metabolite transporter (DMT)-like permease